MCGLSAEAMSGTIETNIREMVEINDGIRGLVQKVNSGDCIATASNNGNGNGSGRVDHEFAGAVEEEI